MAAKTVGSNISYEVKDNKLTITVDLKKEVGDSKSGKTVIIGTTKGNTKFTGPNDQEMIMGINIYKYKDSE